MLLITYPHGVCFFIANTRYSSFNQNHKMSWTLEKETKLGESYLVEHSTGGGKSNTIGWLAYKLFSLFDTDGKIPIFDTILILSDRVNIKEQLSETIHQFVTNPLSSGDIRKFTSI